jgi:16S rRNA (guanine527-N7)-methyltransferase
LAPAQADIENGLRSGLSGLGLEPDDERVAKHAQYLRLLMRWNKAYNLTGLRSLQDMVVRHVLDSLTALPYLAGRTVLDIGTGAGLPGIPLAVEDAPRSFTLVDSNGKKTRFVTQAITELGLGNVSVEQARAEEFQPSQTFDTVICRALSSLEEFVRSCRPLVADCGRLVAMKGRYPDDELQNLPDGWTAAEVAEVDVPGLNAQRHIVVLEHRDRT